MLGQKRLFLLLMQSSSSSSRRLCSSSTSLCETLEGERAEWREQRHDSDDDRTKRTRPCFDSKLYYFYFAIFCLATHSQLSARERHTQCVCKCIKLSANAKFTAGLCRRRSSCFCCAKQRRGEVISFHIVSRGKKSELRIEIESQMIVLDITTTTTHNSRSSAIFLFCILLNSFLLFPSLSLFI